MILILVRSSFQSHRLDVLAAVAAFDLVFLSPQSSPPTLLRLLLDDTSNPLSSVLQHHCRSSCSTPSLHSHGKRSIGCSRRRIRPPSRHLNPFVQHTVSRPVTLGYPHLGLCALDRCRILRSLGSGLPPSDSPAAAGSHHTTPTTTTQPHNHTTPSRKSRKMARWLSKMLSLLAMALWAATVVEAFEEQIVRQRHAGHP